MDSKLSLHSKGFHSLALVITVLCGLVVLLSTSAKAEVLERYKTSGETALAYLSGRTEGGLTVSGSLQISEMMIRDGAGAPDQSGPTGILVLEIFDSETGGMRYGIGEISLSEFDIASSLRSAVAKGTTVVTFMDGYHPYYYAPPLPYYTPLPSPPPSVVPVEPYPPADPNSNIFIPAYPPYPVPTYESIEINVTWTGTGDFMTGHYSSNNTFQDVRTHSRSIGRYNEATVAGSITGETFSLNLEPVTVPDPYGYGYYPYPSSMIGKTSDGYMAIVKP